MGPAAPAADASAVFAVCRRRGPGLLVCMWATQLAGGVYLPVPLAVPAARKHYLLGSTRAKALLTEPALAKELPPCAIPAGVVVFSFEGLGQGWQSFPIDAGA